MSRLQAPRVVVVDAALADGRAAQVRAGVTLLIDGATVARLWSAGEGPDPAGLDAVVIDGSGSTIVPCMVDSHAHLSMPGGARWIERGFDPAEELLAVSEENGELMVRAGIRWARDVGAPRRTGADGRGRALGMVLRDRWVGAHDRPYVRAAGTWISRRHRAAGGAGSGYLTRRRSARGRHGPGGSPWAAPRASAWCTATRSWTRPRRGGSG
jgi:hypothetical protein